MSTETVSIEHACGDSTFRLTRLETGIWAWGSGVLPILPGIRFCPLCGEKLIRKNGEPILRTRDDG